MELKNYQQQVINDLARYLGYLQTKQDLRTAFHDYWTQHPTTPLHPFPNAAIEPYKNNVKGVPHVCVKVPTAGGKTFIACNALRCIFDTFPIGKPKAVVWLVPSVTILEQTLKQLQNPFHPYRQKINVHFGGKVEIYDKASLLQGGSFHASSVQENLSIMVLSFDSLRAKNKEDRKIFQENGNLQSFESILGKDTEISLGAVLKQLNPVVIVDESHNAESELSVEMLKELNPSFMLDLTATPRKHSNIISFIDAIELKKQNMVKLPVIVHNRKSKTEVVEEALHLQRSLENLAKTEAQKGGKYIRPIVLFQVQPKTGKNFRTEEEEKSHVEKLKDTLLSLKIPATHIKIKTAAINELKGIDLMSADCEVRYILTINALKEGWDCPFAYILASLADKNSAIDVEQILGRVLRQPFVQQHSSQMLNMCYVLTASAKFRETLQNIVKGLNKAGFSEKDYRINEYKVETAEKTAAEMQEQLAFFSPQEAEKMPEIAPTNEDEIDTNAISLPIEGENPIEAIAEIAQQARQEEAAFLQKIENSQASQIPTFPNELQSMVKTYQMKEIFAEKAKSLILPQFFVKTPTNDLFSDMKNGENFLEKEHLLKGFALSKCDTHIDFHNLDTELYKVDLDETSKDYVPSFAKIQGLVKERLMEYIVNPAQQTQKIQVFTQKIMAVIGNMYPIADKEIEKYIYRILADFTDEHFSDLIENEYAYIRKMREKITTLSEQYAEKVFSKMLDTDEIFIKNHFILPPYISPSETSKNMTKSLYEKENKMNGFEENVINEIANSENIAFWTKNIEKKGFKINGFINHYPDFIIQTKSGKTLLVETKGDHLEAAQKIALGNLWASKAGNSYRYFLVYDKKNADNAYKLDDFLTILKEI